MQAVLRKDAICVREMTKTWETITGIRLKFTQINLEDPNRSKGEMVF